MDGRQEGPSVERKLYQVVSLHEASLAGLTTLAGATSKHRSHNSSDDSVVDAAARRVACSTLNGDGSTGGSACVGDDVSTICLNPPERATPHHVVPVAVPGSQVDDENSVQRETHDVDFEEDDAALASQKAIATLSALCEEAADLDNIATSSLIPAVLLFGPHPRFSSELGMGGDASLAAKLDERAVCLREAELIARLGKYFVFLQGLHNFTFRCQRLAKNVVCQISACYSAPTPFLSKAHLVPVGESLALVLRLLITIDAAISSNSDLLEAWDLYTSIIKEGLSSIRQPPINSSIDPFKRLIGQLDFSIMSSRSFLAAIEQDFGLNASNTNMTPSSSFPVHEEIKSLISILYERYCSGVGSDSETTEMRDLVGVYGLYALYRRILPSNSVPDAKLHKHLWTAFPQRSPVIALDGNIAFAPREFMIQYAHFEVKGCDHLVAISDAAAFVTTFDSSFPTEAARCRAQTVQWISEVDSRLASSAVCCNVSNDTPAADVETTGALLLKGLVIAHRSSALAKTLLILHKTLEIPLQSSLISALMSLLEALKSIEQMVRSRRRAAVVAVQQPALGLIAATIFRSFDQHREVVDEHKSMGRSPSYDESMSMSKLGACLSTLECTLKGSSTYSTLRSFTAAIACCACADGNVLCGVASEEMALPLLRRLRLLGDIDDNIRKACDCSFIYFHSELMPIFFRNLYQSTTSTGRLQLALSAFADPANLFLHCTPHLDMVDDDTEGALVTAYRTYVTGLLQEEIVQPICHEVESCLRLAIHRKRFGQILSTGPTLNETKRLLPFLEMPPLRSFGGVMEVKRHVEKYLQATFYNLTTVALHDAQLYVEMSILANEKFGLDVADYDLPLGCLEQGFDVLRIMRNIHVFVAKFNYNLNQQSFVERSPVRGSKFLNTVNISSISTSLRQHGIGVINSAVNFTYQFLIEKFHTLSHLLMDDYARSLLSREVRWFITHRRDGGTRYSHERALTFAKEMEKLVSDVSGESLLDRLRAIVSEIGNAVGFVRLVRSAGIRSASGALQFFPEPSLNSTGKSATSLGPRLFSEDATSERCNFKFAESDDLDKKSHRSASLSQESRMASDVLNGVRCSLGHYFEDDTDYCRVLVDVFRSVLLCAEHTHLETFYALLPALCLSWVNSTVQAKEMMYRKNRIGDAYYTDDGFALGFTFVLAILKQKEKVDALDWFSALADKFASDEIDLRKQKAAKNIKVGSKQSSFISSIFGVGTVEKEENFEGEDDEEAITLQAALKQWEEKKRESEALYITMEGALVLFGGI